MGDPQIEATVPYTKYYGAIPGPRLADPRWRAEKSALIKHDGSPSSFGKRHSGRHTSGMWPLLHAYRCTATGASLWLIKFGSACVYQATDCAVKANIVDSACVYRPTVLRGKTTCRFQTLYNYVSCIVIRPMIVLY